MLPGHDNQVHIGGAVVSVGGNMSYWLTNDSGSKLWKQIKPA